MMKEAVCLSGLLPFFLYGGMEMDVIAQADACFAGKSREWSIFEKMRRALLEKWPDTQLRVMKTCIAFDDPKPYCYASLQPKSRIGGAAGHFILVTISLREQMTHPRFWQVTPISKKRYTVHIVVSEESGIDDELLELIALSHR